MVLTRPINKMPDFVRSELSKQGVLKSFNERPPYQRNDYIGWICRAKRKETQIKRLIQMIDELKGGKLYMKMVWRR